VLAPQRAQQQFAAAEVSRLAQFGQYLVEGIWHIWIGFDHILFLLSLLLPAVLVHEARRWRGVGRFREALVEVLWVVTAFTLAHSITLSLAALGLIELPSRLVESAIAASVVLAAANNLKPLVEHRRWMVAFGFGLIHGFGFASVLAELGCRRRRWCCRCWASTSASKSASWRSSRCSCPSPGSCARRPSIGAASSSAARC
jgi:GNAT superfamily N-acetyltransferase